jgi:hypothetical protein
VLAVVLGATTAFDASPRGALVAAAASAVLLLALALGTARTLPIPLAVLVLGALYVVPDGDRAIGAAVYGACLLLMAELAYWSLEERVALRIEPAALGARLLAVLGVVVAGLLAASLVLVAAGTDVTRSTGVIAVGAVALVACVALLTTLANR